MVLEMPPSILPAVPLRSSPELQEFDTEVHRGAPKLESKVATTGDRTVATVVNDDVGLLLGGEVG